jgi:alpha-galactosidase
MDTCTREILTNMEVIAIDQDVLGEQGFKIKDYGEIEVFYKHLSGGEIAICIVNRFDHTVNIELDWKSFSFQSWKDNQKLDLPLTIDRKDISLEGNFQIRDLWKKQNIGSTAQPIKTEIASHDILLMKLTR